jgi:DNA-binding transcriptional LysR family regulator
MEKALACTGPNPRIVFRSGGDDTLLAMIRAGMGAAVLASLVVHAADERGDGDLRVHELRPAPPPWEIGVIWSAGRTHSPLSARATEIAVETAQELERTI